MVFAVGSIACLAQLLNKRVCCWHHGLLAAHLDCRCHNGGGYGAIIGQSNTWQQRTREELEEGTAVVGRPTKDLPTHGLCGWEGRGVSTSHSLAIWVQLTAAI